MRTLLEDAFQGEEETGLGTWEELLTGPARTRYRMNGRSAKLARKAAQDAARQTESAVAPVLNAAAEYSRQMQVRITILESRAESLHRAQHACSAWRDRPFLGRVKWLLLGR